MLTSGHKKLRCSALWLLLWQLLLGDLSAQAIRLEELEIRDAPPLATLVCLFEDSRGFMWFGSLSGLYLFDGYSLTHFKHNPHDSLSISDNKIKKLLEDKQGNFWVGTQVGLNYFDVRKRAFRRYTDKLKYGIGDLAINDLKLDKSGTLWVATEEGLYKMASGAGRFDKYFPANQQQQTPVSTLETDDHGIYICSSAGLLYSDFSTANAVVIPAQAAGYAQIKKEEATTQKDQFGKIWMATPQGLFFYQPFSSEGIVAHPAFTNEPVRFMGGENKRGELWIITQTGLSILHTGTLQCEKNIAFQVSGGEQKSIGISQGCHASTGMVWLSSTTRQLYKIDAGKQRFQHLPISLVEELKSVSLLFEMYEYSPGVLLIPQKSGPALLNISTQKTTPFPYRPDYNLSGWQTGINSFLEEKDGRLWIGTGGGLFLFDKRTRRFINPEQRLPDFFKLRGLTIRKIHRDRKNNLWVATWYGGIFKINFTTGVLKQYLNSREDDVNKTKSTRSILEASDGTMWFGTRGGLLKYLEIADSFLVYKNIPNHPETMSENTAFCIYEGADGHIWCGTYGGGLNQLNVQTGQFKHFTTQDGLLNNNVFSLLPDTQGNLWLLGYDGITKFNPSTGSFQVFTHQHGLLNKEYDAFLYGQSPYSGHMFFCGKKGIDYFHPDSIHLSRLDPKVWITDFKLFNESVPIAGNTQHAGQFALSADIAFTQHLQLRHDQNVLTFDYVALDFSAPQSIQYAYQLVGFDKDWQQVGARRSVTFTNLNPGSYTLKIKATNGDGVWGSKMATLQITVLAPWWRTGWFLTLVMLTVVALAVAFYRYRIGLIQEKAAVRSAFNQRLAEVKMEALQSQMNPHFIYNCLTSLKLYVEKKENEKASFYLSRFATLMRQVLDYSRSEVISLDKELDMLQRYVEMEKMRYKEKFDFRMDILPDVPVQDIKIPPLIIQPYIENAIWHGLQHKTTGQGLLLLEVRMQGDDCRVVIEDNGIGRTASLALKKQSKLLNQSHGLNVTAERMAFFNLKYGTHARIEILDLTSPGSEPAGTRVILTFQTESLQKNAYDLHTD